MTDSQNTDASSASTWSSLSLRRRMWTGRRDAVSVKSWLFDEAPITSQAIDAFVLENACRLLEALAELDTESSSALNSHVASLQEQLLAIHVRRQQNAHLQQGAISSMSFVTKKNAENLPQPSFNQPSGQSRGTQRPQTPIYPSIKGVAFDTGNLPVIPSLQQSPGISSSPQITNSSSSTTRSTLARHSQYATSPTLVPATSDAGSWQSQNAFRLGHSPTSNQSYTTASMSEPQMS